MQALVAVVDAGGFSAAARRDGRSKALLSKHVSDLEDRLGARLINRTTRQISLTEAGRVYYQEAVEILQKLAELEASIQDVHGQPRGRLRMSAPRTLDGPISDALMAFLKDHPLIAVDLHLEDRFVDLVEEGFDVAVRVAELEDSSLVARRLAPFRLVVCAAPDIIALHGDPRHPQRLGDLPCVIDSNARAKANWPFVVDGARLAVAVSGRVLVNSPHAARSAALAGFGFARVPYDVIADDVAAGRLILCLAPFERTGSSIYAVYPHRRHLSVKVRTFVDFLVAWFAARAGPASGE